MKNNFRYYLVQAIRSVFRNGLMSATSIFTVVCCMLILGVFLSVSINVNHIAGQLESQCEIQAFIDETYTDDQILQVQKKVLELPNIAKADIHTKEDAYNDMREVFAENAALLDGYVGEDNPFRCSLKITLVELEDISVTMEQIKGVEGIAEVRDKLTTMQNVLNFSNSIKNISFWGMLLLCVVSVFIIANTIKLAVYSRRKEIGVMKFVGATDWFIRWPFIFEGVIIGIIGALIAFGLVSWGYVSIFGQTKTTDLFTLKAYKDIAVSMLGIFISIGTLIGALGSAFSIRKHLDV